MFAAEHNFKDTFMIYPSFTRSLSPRRFRKFTWSQRVPVRMTHLHAHTRYSCGHCPDAHQNAHHSSVCGNACTMNSFLYYLFFCIILYVVLFMDAKLKHVAAAWHCQHGYYFCCGRSDTSQFNSLFKTLRPVFFRLVIKAINFPRVMWCVCVL